MENQQLPKRKPTPKLSFPGFGNSKTENVDIKSNHMLWLFLAVVAFLIGNTIYDLRKMGDKVSRGQSTITKMEWKGRITKKYMGYDKPDIHMFDYLDSTQNAHIVDVSKDKSGFYDLIMPLDSIYKSKGALRVRIKNYTRDTTVNLLF